MKKFFKESKQLFLQNRDNWGGGRDSKIVAKLGRYRGYE